MLLDLTYLNGTPAFRLHTSDTSLSRVHGAFYDKDDGCWYFPAYPPFGQLAFDDLKKVVKPLELSSEVQAHGEYLARGPSRILPEGFEFVTQPFDHQIGGLAEVLYYPRWALLWDPGVGKSKVIVDLLRARPRFTLIFAPRIAVANWLKEIHRHSGGTLRAAALAGTPKQKRKILSGYKELDVLVMSYGTVRTMARPTLLPRALARFNEISAIEGFVAALARLGGHPPAPSKITPDRAKTVARIVRLLADPDRQRFYIDRWASGVTLAAVEREVTAEAALTPQWLCDLPYERLVPDESHNLAQASSEQTKAALFLSVKAPERYLLTGTLEQGDPRHVYSQLRFLAPSAMPEDWLTFSNRFLVRAPHNMRIVTGYRNLNIINERVQRVSSRLKKEDCLTLPERLPPIDIEIDLSGEQKKLYNELVNRMEVDVASLHLLGRHGFFDSEDTATTLVAQSMAVLLNKLCQLRSGFINTAQKDTEICDRCPHLRTCVAEGVTPYTQRCKVVQEPPATTVRYTKENPVLDALGDLLDEVLADKEHKIIVWAWFLPELDIIERLLKERGLGYVRVDGSTRQTQVMVDRFNDDPAIRVYLGQEATGISVTLNAASYMVYFTIDWRLNTYIQSMDRNYRVGQTKKLTVYRLVANGTLDSYKIAALDMRKDISRMITGKLACTTCEKRFECLRDGIELFDPGCVYKRSMRKKTAHAETIDE